ncbi:unnamed protein product [Dovyalis caffra]|uniref:F-box domain-containing protein n=1 Tax=Dovyalis caffra TaxID=77055 RepID=A0AAV1R642_9ROSI|nr:unnamed protein product [Dovyalis caffra]
MPKLTPELPSEIISDILSRLPVKCLVRFKCVSKTWRSLISHPEFAKMHLKRTKEDNNVNHHKIFLSTNPFPCIFDPEEYCDGDCNLLTTQLHFPIAHPEYNYIFILGSCNGLVCGLFESDPLIHIWNPSTRESKEVALPNYLDACECFYGFGYDSQLDDYKIIVGSMCTSPNRHGSKIETKVEVFTLKSNSWRTVQDLCFSVLLGGPGALANGVLHWLVTQDSGRPTAMVSFDLVEEKFQEMVPLRGLTGDAIYWHYELGVLGEWLCLYSDYGLSSDCEAWIMKEYSSEASWTSFLRFKGESNPGAWIVGGIKAGRLRSHVRSLISYAITRKSNLDSTCENCGAVPESTMHLPVGWHGLQQFGSYVDDFKAWLQANMVTLKY